MLDTCKNCEERGLIVNESEGTIVCPYCGVVQGTRIIDETSEWRNFAKESSAHGGDNGKRVGEANNNLLPDRGICTIISGNGLKDSAMTRWNQRATQSGIEKSLTRGFKSIDELCNNLNLGDVVKEEAKILFKSVNDEKFLKGRTHNAIVSSCVFIACRKKNNPRSIREISTAMNVERKDILKCYSTVKKSLPQMHNNKSAAEYAKRYASLLGFNQEANKLSQLIAEKAIEKGFVAGKSPLSVASAAVYFVGRQTGDSRSLYEISMVSSMKEITIKNCFTCINDNIDEITEILPHGWQKLDTSVRY